MIVACKGDSMIGDGVQDGDRWGHVACELG